MILFALVVVAVWVVLHPVSLPEPRAARAQDDEWRLPARAKPDTEALAATIERDRLWGASGLAPIEDKPLTAPNWRIAGIVSAGAESYALLETVGQPAQQIRAGGKLPGGATILNMTADRLCILLNGKKRFLKTYKE